MSFPLTLYVSKPFASLRAGDEFYLDNRRGWKATSYSCIWEGQDRPSQIDEFCDVLILVSQGSAQLIAPNHKGIASFE